MRSSTIVKTKLFPPLSRSSLVQRTRLLETLTNNRSKKLILVAAPAGFGKTTILGQWFESLQKEKQASCWCSLDHDDNNSSRFLRHIIGALRTCADIGLDIIRQLDSTLISDITDTLPALINDLSDIDSDITLFIDDFHYISSEQINQYVELLINLAPANFRLIIAGRIRPALSLSNLRVRNELCEINANQLRFDTDEARDFMHDVVGLDLSTEHLESLYEHSEGWAAGLQLASLSLHDPSRRDKFIASFSGSLRDIADYLASDVLDQQEPEIRDFLLRTSVLERLCPPACNALTEQNNGQVLLSKIETGNLFLVPLDETNEWFRYHHLFQEFLRAQLRRVYPEAIVPLYRRASDWFAQSGYINEAVNYALLASDMHRLGQLVHTGTLETMAMEGRMAELLSWVSSIPQSVKTKFPRLLIQECIALSHLCRPVQASDVAEQAYTAIKQLDSIADYHYTQAEIAKIRDEQKVLNFMIAFCKDDIEGMATQAHESIDSDDDLILGMAHNFIGYSLIELAQLDEALIHLKKARFHHVKKTTYYGAIFSDCFMSIVSLLQYKLHDAYEHACAAQQLVGNIDGGHVPGMSKAKVMQAVVLYEWNKIDEARALLESYLPMIEDAGQISITQYGLLTLARCYRVRHEFELAIKTLEKCSLLSQHTNRSYINLALELEKLSCSYFSVNTENIPSTHDYTEIEGLIQVLQEKWNRVSFAHLQLLLHSCVYSGQEEHFLRHFDSVDSLLAAKNLNLLQLKLRMLSIIANIHVGHNDKACALLMEVIELVYPENGLRLMLDSGVALLPILQSAKTKYQNRGEALKMDFIEQVSSELSLSTDNHSASTPAAQIHTTTPPLIENLSTREIEILELLANGESNSVVSNHLLISENTVKWHIKNLYSKLGVKNRTSAVVIAQQHGIIS